MRSCLSTLAIALMVNLLLYWIIALFSGNPDFAALLTAAGSITAILGLCHGYASAFGEFRQSAEERSHASALARRARIGGWLLAGCTTAGLLVIQPTGWTPWMLGGVWGVLGGSAFAITFTIVSRGLAGSAE